MSAKPLAELLDGLHAAKEAFVAEAPNSVSVSNLSVESARNVLALINSLGWEATCFDSANTKWSAHELSDEFAPFRINFSKPDRRDGSLLILTNVGFLSFLDNSHSATVWRIARLGSTIRTLGRIFLDWEAVEEFAPAPNTKNPRLLVRESTTPRMVPDDIRPWVIVGTDYAFDTTVAIQWASVCILIALRSLADEIDSSSGQLKFKGPPRLSLSLPQPPNYYEELGIEAFKLLQQALSWVYENEREAEVRHILLATELARSGGGEENVIKRLRGDIFGALEGAKIAYQMSISEMGKDTLKTLSDLRKAITEDTSKVADSTRQTATAVASALALGLGLVAARLTTSTAPWLIFLLMIVIAFYVASVIYFGYDFIRLQRQLRADWQPRLYRFLPEPDYERMVNRPARHAEQTFIRSAFIGGVAVLSLTGALGYSWLCAPETKGPLGPAQTNATEDKTKTPDNQVAIKAQPAAGNTISSEAASRTTKQSTTNFGGVASSSSKSQASHRTGNNP